MIGRTAILPERNQQIILRDMHVVQVPCPSQQKNVINIGWRRRKERKIADLFEVSL